MKEPPDSWAKPIATCHGHVVSGGAARAVRIANIGGMQELLDDLARRALELAAETSKED